VPNLSRALQSIPKDFGGGVSPNPGPPGPVDEIPGAGASPPGGPGLLPPAIEEADKEAHAVTMNILAEGRPKMQPVEEGALIGLADALTEVIDVLGEGEVALPVTEQPGDEGGVHPMTFASLMGVQLAIDEAIPGESERRSIDAHLAATPDGVAKLTGALLAAAQDSELLAAVKGGIDADTGTDTGSGDLPAGDSGGPAIGDPGGFPAGGGDQF